MGKNLLSPGTLVTCRGDAPGGLIMWSSYRSEIEDDIGKADQNEIMLILKSRKPAKKELCSLTPEWKTGAYLILAAGGKKGWVGAGWVIPVTI